jgi:hypothetical protein
MVALEIVLAVLQNLSCIACVAGVILSFFVVLFYAMGFSDGCEELKANARRLVKPLIVCIVIAVIPSPNDLWKVRVALIKLQLASPENIESGVKRINEISKELECKYLAHCEEKK